MILFILTLLGVLSAGIADVRQIQPLPQLEKQVLHDLMTAINLENIGWHRDYISEACNEKNYLFVGLTCGDALIHDTTSGDYIPTRFIEEL